VIKKLERKVIDTPEPGISEGWEALYESSVKVK